MARIKQKDIEIAGHVCAPGSRTTFNLAVPDLYIHADLSIPVHVIHGRYEGPTLFVSGAVHGDEIMGVEIIRRMLKTKKINQIRGTVIAVPVVNIFGFLNQSRYLPDRRDLNRCFPGSGKGSIAARLANLFVEQIVAKCTHGIDLHTAAVNRENLPQVRCDTAYQECVGMAKAFGLPVVVASSVIDKSLREAALALGVNVIVYETGEALRFDEKGIRAGVNGIFNVMTHLDMLSKVSSPRARPPLEPSITQDSRWIRAPQSGIFRSLIPLGARVKRGDIMGYICNPLGENETEIVATRGGIIIGRNNLPLVTEGEALFHLAWFDEPIASVAREIDMAEEVLEVNVHGDEPAIT